MLNVMISTNEVASSFISHLFGTGNTPRCGIVLEDLNLYVVLRKHVFQDFLGNLEAGIYLHMDNCMTSITSFLETFL